MSEGEEPIEVRNGPYAVIVRSSALSMIRLSWTGYAPSREYREILEQALSEVEEHEVQRWSADLRDMAAILQQDEHWTVTDWFPRLAAAGLKRMAILMSSDLFNQMSVERIMGAATPVLGFEVAYFDDMQKAEAWLMASDR